MLRITHGPGLGALGFDANSIANSVVNAVMPALRQQMPSLVESAMPTIKAQVPAMVPVVAGQVPALIDSSMPAVRAKLVPVLRTELEKGLTSYAETYFGTAAPYLKWAPAIALAGTVLSIAASAVILYQFYESKRAVPNRARRNGGMDSQVDLIRAIPYLSAYHAVLSRPSDDTLDTQTTNAHKAGVSAFSDYVLFQEYLNVYDRCGDYD